MHCVNIYRNAHIMCNYLQECVSIVCKNVQECVCIV